MAMLKMIRTADFIGRNSLRVGLCAWLVVSHGRAADDERDPANTSQPQVSSAYCGLHCVYGASQILGKSVEFDEILQPEFLTGRYGSTAADLVSAFGKFGIDAGFHQFVSVDRLRRAAGPVVLHVRAPGVSAYAHWVLFLGFEGDRIVIYDPPRERSLITPSDLLGIWDGSAVVPTAEEDAGWAFTWLPVSLATVSVVILALAVSFVGRRWRWRWPSLSVPIATAASVVFMQHCILGTGFAQGRAAVGGIVACYFRNEFPAVSLTELKSMMQESGTVVVDARPATAFEQFHLPGAVNIPVDSGYGTLSTAISELAENRRVVFYCQSEGCLWADAVANQVYCRGFNDVLIYRGGVNEWMGQGNE